MNVKTLNCDADSIDAENLLERLYEPLDEVVIEAAEQTDHTLDVSGYVDEYRVVLMDGDLSRSLTIEKRDAGRHGVRDVSVKFSTR